MADMADHLLAYSERSKTYFIKNYSSNEINCRPNDKSLLIQTSWVPLHYELYDPTKNQVFALLFMIPHSKFMNDNRTFHSQSVFSFPTTFFFACRKFPPFFAIFAIAKFHLYGNITPLINTFMRHTSERNLRRIRKRIKFEHAIMWSRAS